MKAEFGDRTMKQKTGNKKNIPERVFFFCTHFEGRSKNETISEPNPDCGVLPNKGCCRKNKRKKETCMKKWKRIPSAILAVLLLSGSMPVWAAETVDLTKQAGRHPGTQRKAGRTDPRRRAWEVYKKEPIGE